MFGLRTRMGIPRSRFKELTDGESLDKVMIIERKKLTIVLIEHFIKVSG